jgi:ABC-type sulfate/molybdate transport systems ATPase subunit
MLEVAVDVWRANFRLTGTLQAPAGVVTVITGPSGAGKTTLLLCIAGLVRPRPGRVIVDGAVWQDEARCLPPEARAVGWVPQSLALFPHLSARDNVAFGVERGLDRGQRAARADEALRAAGAGALGDRRPSTLSGGEAQRVALARALARRPRVLLLDEPLAALDRPLRRALATEIRRIVESEGLYALHVTHDDEEAGLLGGRVVRVEGGRVAGAAIANPLDSPARSP